MPHNALWDIMHYGTHSLGLTETAHGLVAVTGLHYGTLPGVWNVSLWGSTVPEHARAVDVVWGVLQWDIL